VKWVLKKSALTLLGLIAVVFLFKIAQRICWENNFTVIAPPSLDSWDPTERVDAARQAMKKYGGGKQ